MPIIGIDLGTTNSLVACAEGASPRIIPVDGRRLLPSIVGHAPDVGLLIGEPARNQYLLRPESTVRSVKRHMGDADWRCLLGGRSYDSVDVSALILRHLKQAAEAEVGLVTQAVITVPAYFGEAQRRATVEAGRRAGLDVVRILNEPTAAALVYALGSPVEGKVLVYDLGGGTFDVSVVEMGAGVAEVIASHGHRRLGGDDFDELIVVHLQREFSQEHGIDLLQHPEARARLYRAAEEAKVALSSQGVHSISEEFIAQKGGQPLHFQTEITRLTFESLIEDLLENTMQSVRRALADARCDADEIGEILLVGGSTRIPAVIERISEELGRPPHHEIDPDAVVALGAAAQAAIIAGEDVGAIFVDVSPHALGIATLDPMTGEDTLSTVIARNTAIPTTRSRLFYTLYPEQETVRIRVYQGEDRDIEMDELLGEFECRGLSPSKDPSRPREVLVHFDYDLNGMLRVRAEDRPSGRTIEHRIEVTGSAEPILPAGLSVDERGAFRRLSFLNRQSDLGDAVRREISDLIERAVSGETGEEWLQQAVEVLYRHDPEY